MKIKTVLWGSLMSGVVLLLVHQYCLAQAGPVKATLPIGTVSVSRAIRECKATAKFGEKARAENEKMDADQDQLTKEVQALAATIRAGALKSDSNDYQQQYQELYKKQAQLKTMQDYNPQRKALAQQLWTEKIYKEVLRITKELASQKKLALVLAVDEPEFPMPRYEELVMALRTHKVLYGGGCLDLTDEVIAALDKEQAKLGD
jgi:Skp family chaperone for outer membrane proteins